MLLHTHDKAIAMLLADVTVHVGVYHCQLLGILVVRLFRSMITIKIINIMIIKAGH